MKYQACLSKLDNNFMQYSIEEAIALTCLANEGESIMPELAHLGYSKSTSIENQNTGLYILLLQKDNRYILIYSMPEFKFGDMLIFLMSFDAMLQNIKDKNIALANEYLQDAIEKSNGGDLAIYAYSTAGVVTGYEKCGIKTFLINSPGGHFDGMSYLDNYTENIYYYFSDTSFITSSQELMKSNAVKVFLPENKDFTSKLDLGDIQPNIQGIFDYSQLSNSKDMLPLLASSDISWQEQYPITWPQNMGQGLCLFTRQDNPIWQHIYQQQHGDMQGYNQFAVNRLGTCGLANFGIKDVFAGKNIVGILLVAICAIYFPTVLTICCGYLYKHYCKRTDADDTKPNEEGEEVNISGDDNFANMEDVYY